MSEQRANRPVFIRFPPDLLAAVEAEADAQGEAVTDWVCRACAAVLEPQWHPGYARNDADVTRAAAPPARSIEFGPATAAFWPQHPVAGPAEPMTRLRPSDAGGDAPG